jgi:SH3-like domain-containing protein
MEMRLTLGRPLSNSLPQAGERTNEKSNVQSLKRWATLLLLVAFDFVSVAETAILYDANSLKAKKLFVATRYLPLEQVVELDNWVKVRDFSGKLFWIEKRQVSNKRYVMVTVPVSTIRRNPEDDAEVVFKATQQLSLEWLGNTGTGWVKVRHADGTMGYAKSVDVWGD